MGVRLHWLANARLPTEKAHGLQIVQNCHALAAAGADVRLIVPRRINTPDLAGRDVHDYYGVPHSFAIERRPTVDLLPWTRGHDRAAALLQGATFALAARRHAGPPPDVYYSRDVLPLLAARRRGTPLLAYEAHQLARGRIGRWLERRCLRATDLVVAVTDHLAMELRARGARRVVVLRDGFQADRFAGMPERASARARLGLPADAFLVGYAGRLETMGMPKGLDLVIDAIARLGRPNLGLVVIGGPAEAADTLRRHWVSRGLAASAFHCPGAVPPSAVPAWLAALDVCVAPFPRTVHFDLYASPLKLFEYMAAGRAIVASALQSVREVLEDGRSALLVPPGDVDALAGALARLQDDDRLRDGLATAAQAEAAAYTWDARARAILHLLADGQAAGVTGPGRPSTRETSTSPPTVKTT